MGTATNWSWVNFFPETGDYITDIKNDTTKNDTTEPPDNISDEPDIEKPCQIDVRYFYNGFVLNSYKQGFDWLYFPFVTIDYVLLEIVAGLEINDVQSDTSDKWKWLAIGTLEY